MNESFAFQKPLLSDLPHCMSYFALPLRKLRKRSTKQYEFKLLVWYSANEPKKIQCGVKIVHSTCNKRCLLSLPNKDNKGACRATNRWSGHLHAQANYVNDLLLSVERKTRTKVE